MRLIARKAIFLGVQNKIPCLENIEACQCVIASDEILNDSGTIASVVKGKKNGEIVKFIFERSFQIKMMFGRSLNCEFYDKNSADQLILRFDSDGCNAIKQLLQKIAMEYCYDSISKGFISELLIISCDFVIADFGFVFVELEMDFLDTDKIKKMELEHVEAALNIILSSSAEVSIVYYTIVRYLEARQYIVLNSAIDQYVKLKQKEAHDQAPLPLNDCYISDNWAYINGVNGDNRIKLEDMHYNKSFSLEDYALTDYIFIFDAFELSTYEEWSSRKYFYGNINISNGSLKIQVGMGLYIFCANDRRKTESILNIHRYIMASYVVMSVANSIYVNLAANIKKYKSSIALSAGLLIDFVRGIEMKIFDIRHFINQDQYIFYHFVQISDYYNSFQKSYNLAEKILVDSLSKIKEDERYISDIKIKCMCYIVALIASLLPVLSLPHLFLSYYLVGEGGAFGCIYSVTIFFIFWVLIIVIMRDYRTKKLKIT